MELIPAIDLLDGRVVRLHQGDYDQVTVFSEEPAELARALEAEGATRLNQSLHDDTAEQLVTRALSVWDGYHTRQPAKPPPPL